MFDYLTGTTDPLLDPVVKSYYEANLKLVRTIAIKSSLSADLLNIALVNNYGQTSVYDYSTITGAYSITPKTEWKYYLNLAGEYHPLDQVMKVVSLDTGNQIVFNKENLEDHPQTKAAYQFGSYYYKALVNQYPDQEDLIMGILMPCDIQTAIDAEDGTILRYDTLLVEDQEYSLMKDLEFFIKNHMARYYVDAYSQTDEYYPMAYFSSLYLQMFPKLLNLRDSRRHGYEVHSFHLRMFLKGFMNLDKYYFQMTRQQAMYLYRNLPRLVTYVGNTEQFNELIDHILTERLIPISGYNLRHYNLIGSDYSPIPTVETEPLNQYRNYAETRLVKPTDAFDEEKPILYGTSDYYNANEDKVIENIKNNNGSSALTKDLVSKILNYEGTFESQLKNIALTHWAYMCTSGLYNVNVSFQDQRSGTYSIKSVKTLFIYLYYLTLSYMGYKPTIIPNFLCQKKIRSTKPDISELLSVVEDSYRDQLTSTAQDLLDNFVPMTQKLTTEQFSDFCVNIYQYQLYQNNLINSFEDHTTHGYVRGMVSKLYEDVLIRLSSTPITMNQFLTQNNLALFGDVIDLTSLISSIYNLGTDSLGDLQPVEADVHKAMINIMRALTSYNIQFIDIIGQPDAIDILTGPNLISSVIVGDPSGSGPDTNPVSQNVYIPVGVQFLDILIDGEPTTYLDVSDAILIWVDDVGLDVSDAIFVDTDQNAPLTSPGTGDSGWTGPSTTQPGPTGSTGSTGGTGGTGSSGSTGPSDWLLDGNGQDTTTTTNPITGNDSSNTDGGVTTVPPKSTTGNPPIDPPAQPTPPTNPTPNTELISTGFSNCILSVTSTRDMLYDATSHIQSSYNTYTLARAVLNADANALTNLKNAIYSSYFYLNNPNNALIQGMMQSGGLIDTAQSQLQQVVNTLDQDIAIFNILPSKVLIDSSGINMLLNTTLTQLNVCYNFVASLEIN